MKYRFIALWNRINAQGNAEDEFNKLISIYSKPQRFYHNMENHINNCLIEFDSVKELAQKPDILELGIWYHDAIHNDEEKSAQLAYDVCVNAQLLDDANFAKDLILFTKHDSIPKAIDLKLIMDIDLSILGKNADEFNEYEKNIRKEYSWVPEFKFREERIKILQRFLYKESIYLTDFFRGKYESKARENLQKSINDLLNRI
jgi:predicted metal-dependent HD superfamily phosphohydrolase